MGLNEQIAIMKKYSALFEGYSVNGAGSFHQTATEDSVLRHKKTGALILVVDDKRKDLLGVVAEPGNSTTLQQGEGVEVPRASLRDLFDIIQPTPEQLMSYKVMASHKPMDVSGTLDLIGAEPGDLSSNVNEEDPQAAANARSGWGGPLNEQLQKMKGVAGKLGVNNFLKEGEKEEKSDE